MVNVALRSGRIIMQNVGRYLKKIYNLIVLGKKKSFDSSQNLDSDEILPSGGSDENFNYK